MKRTKIVCTIGPASEKKEMLENLIKAGMNVMRMNFSHGDYDEQSLRIKNIRELNQENNWNVGMMLDTKGPEIRTGYLKDDKPVKLVQGNLIRLTMDYSYLGDENKIAISYSGLYEDISIGGRILVEDGNITLTVVEKDEENKELICRIENGRILKNKRNCNVPGVVLNMPYMSEKDKADIEFACDQNLDFIAASFVRRADDIRQIREVLANKENSRIQLISKIENQEGVENMEEIIDLSDGVMVARGDLGVDVNAWELPRIQKDMISYALEKGKICVTATQMLDSMQQNPRPTRAEVTDCHNAVLDGTSATMLSGESAQGDYPVESVSYMAKIDEEAEQYFDHQGFLDSLDLDDLYLEEAIGYSVACLVSKVNFPLIVCDGIITARGVGKFRPDASIIACCEDSDEARSLSLDYGVSPVVGDLYEVLEDIFINNPELDAVIVVELFKYEIVLRESILDE